GGATLPRLYCNRRCAAARIRLNIPASAWRQSAELGTLGPGSGPTNRIDQGLRGRSVLNLLALFRHRRAPSRRSKPGNGRWQETGLSSAGASAKTARATASKSTSSRPRRQRRASRDPAQTYLAAHGLEKT